MHMPLILAIEPDRDQATQVNAIVRGRLRAELVLEGSAERALAELGDRVPDLILTAALLSPKDEAALAERLRALESAAAHVHTLTIPVLAAPRSRPRIGGMLSALRRDKAASELDGCDPAVFAEQCATYLERAMEERQAALHAAAHDEAALDHHEHQAPAAMAQEWIEAEPETAASAGAHDDSSFSSDDDESVFASAIDTVIEATEGEELIASGGPGAIVADVENVAIDPPLAEQHAAADRMQEQPDEPPSAEEIADDPMTEDIADQPAVVERRDVSITEPPRIFEERGEESVEELRVEPIEPTAVAIEEPETVSAIEDAPAPATDAGDALLEDSPLFELVHESESDPAPENQDDLEKYIELDLSEFLDQSNAPILHAVSTDGGRSSSSPSSAAVETIAASAAPADFRSEQPGSRPQSARKPEPPADAPEEDDWLQVVEALRRDVERLDATPLASVRAPKALKKGARKLKSKPIQDEWGFFDPEQCGFAALLAKLDEVAASNDPKRRRTKR
jgi:hypothetical protein